MKTDSKTAQGGNPGPFESALLGQHANATPQGRRFQPPSPIGSLMSEVRKRQRVMFRKVATGPTRGRLMAIRIEASWRVARAGIRNSSVDAMLKDASHLLAAPSHVYDARPDLERFEFDDLDAVQMVLDAVAWETNRPKKRKQRDPKWGRG